MIQAGRLRHQITFCTVETVRDDYGDNQITLIESFEKRAEVIDNSSNREVLAQGLNTEGELTFHCRYDERINSELVIKFRSLEYDIQNIENPGFYDRELYITVTSRV